MTTGSNRVPYTRPTVYLETTIISYLAAFPSRDLIVAAHQQITHEWWETQARGYDLYISELVLKEVSRGDAEAAARRLAVIGSLPVLQASDVARHLAEEIVRRGLVPAPYGDDAAHIALASVHGMEYLLTWNCTHLANAAIRRDVERFLMECGYEPPLICTPADMTED